MSNPKQQTVILSDGELRALALRIAAEQLRLTDMWMDWELYPMLDQKGFELLEAEVQLLGAELQKRSKAFDLAEDIDSAYLLELVS